MIDYIMIHHSGVSHKRNKNQFRANNEYHKAKWNFKSITGYYLGYNYEISADGVLIQARQDGEQTAACYQQEMNNGKCIHICLDGNFDIEQPTAKQIYALRDLLREKVKEHNLTADKIVFHRNYSDTNCPGSNLKLDFVRSLVRVENKEESITENPKEELIQLLEQVIKYIKEKL